MVRVLIPPLFVSLALLTAATLLLTAAAIVPPPLTDAVASRPAPSTSVSASPPPTAAIADTRLVTTSSTMLARSARAVPPPPPMVVDLARLSYAPGTGGTSRALPGLLLLAIESGALTVHVDGLGKLIRAGHSPVSAEGMLTLNAGDGLVLPAATAAAFRNEGAVPVVALAAGLFPAAVAQGSVGIGLPQDRAAPARWIDEASPGATATPLAGGWLVDASAGPASVELRRMSLQPHGKASLRAPGAVILAVEAGTLSLAIGQGLVWRQTPDGPDEWIAPASEAVLRPGDGALLQDRPEITARNDGSGPLLILVLTVTPAVERETPSDGMP